jgi:hypothetical protein
LIKKEKEMMMKTQNEKVFRFLLNDLINFPFSLNLYVFR